MVDAKIDENTVIIKLLILHLLPFACIIFCLYNFDTTFTLALSCKCGIIHVILLR